MTLPLPELPLQLPPKTNQRFCGFLSDYSILRREVSCQLRSISLNIFPSIFPPGVAQTNHSQSVDFLHFQDLETDTAIVTMLSGEGQQSQWCLSQALDGCQRKLSQLIDQKTSTTTSDWLSLDHFANDFNFPLQIWLV